MCCIQVLTLGSRYVTNLVCLKPEQEFTMGVGHSYKSPPWKSRPGGAGHSYKSLPWGGSFLAPGWFFLSPISLPRKLLMFVIKYGNYQYFEIKLHGCL